MRAGVIGRREGMEERGREERNGGDGRRIACTHQLLTSTDMAFMKTNSTS